MGRPEVFRVKEDPVTLVNTEVARKSAVNYRNRKSPTKSSLFLGRGGMK